MGLMKRFDLLHFLSLSFIIGIGLFELFYRHNFLDGYLALGMSLFCLFIFFLLRINSISFHSIVPI